MDRAICGERAARLAEDCRGRYAPGLPECRNGAKARARRESATGLRKNPGREHAKAGIKGWEKGCQPKGGLLILKPTRKNGKHHT